jgi:flavin reductase (DIM6/NTAB) family NADH-FMN oxidoreductase RutF
MFYDPEKNDHGMPHNPFKSLIVPRPIGWISTVSAEGVHNLAPYSQFQMVNSECPYVMVGCNQQRTGRRKDTVVNIEETGEFVYNMATYDLRMAMNVSAADLPPEVDEFAVAGLTKAPSIRVKPCRVAESPVQMECRHYQTIRLPGYTAAQSVDVIIGKVVCIHIKDEMIDANGKIDIVKIRPLARLGYQDYSSVDSIFEIVRPTEHDLAGLQAAAAKKTLAASGKS